MDKYYIRKEDSDGKLSYFFSGNINFPKFSAGTIFLFTELDFCVQYCKECSELDKSSLYLVFSLDGKIVG